MDLLIILLVVLLLCGGGYNYGYAHAPSSIVTVLLIVVAVILVLRLLQSRGTFLLIPFAIASLFLSGCSTQQQQVAVNFANSPAGQKVIATTINAILDATLNAGDQYIATGKVDPNQVAQVIIGDAINALRKLRGTAKASNQAAIAEAISASGGGAIAPSVAAQVIAAEQQGISPDQAIDAAITALHEAPKAQLKRNLQRHK